MVKFRKSTKIKPVVNIMGTLYDIGHDASFPDDKEAKEETLQDPMAKRSVRKVLKRHPKKKPTVIKHKPYVGVTRPTKITVAKPPPPKFVATPRPPVKFFIPITSRTPKKVQPPPKSPEPHIEAATTKVTKVDDSDDNDDYQAELDELLGIGSTDNYNYNDPTNKKSELDLSEVEDESKTDTEATKRNEDADFKRDVNESEYVKLDKFYQFPTETKTQRINRELHRLKQELHETGKSRARIWGPLDLMNYQKKAIIKTALIRARRHERVDRKQSKFWDSSSESEDCVDCYAPKSIRKTQYKMHSSYHNGLKRASLFAVIVKWVTVFIGLYDFFLTFYMLLRMNSIDMWTTFLQAKQQLNCFDNSIEPYQIEILYYSINLINSINLFFSTKRSNYLYILYWLSTQVIIGIFAPIHVFFNTRFNAKFGNVGSLIRTQVLFQFVLTLKFGIALYRYYMIKKPFDWRRLNWFSESERNRQLNQDLGARHSSFLQKKNAYRNAFKAALYSVISALVENYEKTGQPLEDDEVRGLIQKYDEALNDITKYPGLEQYLRMAYMRFCIQRGVKDDRILKSESHFFKIRDEKLRASAIAKVKEIKEEMARESAIKPEDVAATEAAKSEKTMISY